jgi:hypothetical protein
MFNKTMIAISVAIAFGPAFEAFAAPVQEASNKSPERVRVIVSGSKTAPSLI